MTIQKGKEGLLQKGKEVLYKCYVTVRFCLCCLNHGFLHTIL